LLFAHNLVGYVFDNLLTEIELQDKSLQKA